MIASVGDGAIALWAGVAFLLGAGALYRQADRDASRVTFVVRRCALPTAFVAMGVLALVVAAGELRTT